MKRAQVGYGCLCVAKSIQSCLCMCVFCVGVLPA